MDIEVIVTLDLFDIMHVVFMASKSENFSVFRSVLRENLNYYCCHGYKTNY